MTYHARAEGKALVDYAFHLIVTDSTEQVLGQELPALIAEGYTSFKIYMTYDDLKLGDREILEILSLARREGAIAIMIHAENSDCIAWLAERLLSAGKTAPKYHAAAHTKVIEREATHRAITLAEIVDVPILIVHVSGVDAVEQIRHARARGLRIYAETCPQYIYLTADDLDLEGRSRLCRRQDPGRERPWPLPQVRQTATGTTAGRRRHHHVRFGAPLILVLSWRPTRDERVHDRKPLHPTDQHAFPLRRNPCRGLRLRRRRSLGCSRSRGASPRRFRGSSPTTGVLLNLRRRMCPPLSSSSSCLSVSAQSSCLLFEKVTP